MASHEIVTWLTVVQRIDTKNESIELVSTSNTDASGLASGISTTEPRYSLYRYTNDLEGSQRSPLLFIYTCPDGQKVRDRMMYAGFKIGFLTALKNEHGLEVVKKVMLSQMQSADPELTIRSSKLLAPQRSQCPPSKTNSDQRKKRSRVFLAPRGQASGR